MSSKRGENNRKRPQRHQNSTIFKNDLHDKSDRIKKLNSMSIVEVCPRCVAVIEWKIRYRKYKALKAPASCHKCLQRNIKKAYHVLCRDCAIANRQCAKCLKSADDVDILPPELSPEEKLKLKVEMDSMIKYLSERKRRTFLRYMNGRKKRKNPKDDEEDYPEEKEKEVPTTRTREELLQKIAKLKLQDEGEFKDVLESDSEDSDSDDFSDVEED